MHGLKTAVGNAVGRRAGSTGRSAGNRPRRSVHAPGPMAFVWITVARGVMAIVLGLALALPLGGAVLISDAVLMRRRLLADPEDPGG
jgi:hypothetical protein